MKKLLFSLTTYSAIATLQLALMSPVHASTENSAQNKNVTSNEYRYNKPFVAAISGGADSLALAALSELYRIEKKIIIHFILIDHGIRKNSQKEAKSVQKLLKKFSIFLKIKKNSRKIKANIQKAARDTRYKFLSDFCIKKKIKYILTAHHMDDQIETFLIRLSRGSGVQGLSSMNRVSKLSNKVKIVRPFLDIKKKRFTIHFKKSF